MRIGLGFFAAIVLSATAAISQEGTTVYKVDGTFDDAEFNFENAIIERGLLVDLTSHVASMLERTGPDVGDETKILENGLVFMFCSAVLSRQVIKADPANMSYCPYGIFIYEPADGSGDVFVGYRNMPDGEMQVVQELLDGIAREVADQ